MNRFPTTGVLQQLDRRRAALQQAIDTDRTVALGRPPADDLLRLLREVDRALERWHDDQFGRCVVCHDPVDPEHLADHPLARYCLCDLNRHQQQALERDLELAWEVQASLLPPQDLLHAGWQSHFRYRPAGPVSGDYCDLIPHARSDEWLYFLLGDVSGKGVAAAYWMAHLAATVRRSLDEPVSIAVLLETVNRHLTDRGASTHFATLIAGRADRGGTVELINAGHCRPIMLSADGARELPAHTMPLGIDAWEQIPCESFQLQPGDSLLLYSDGLSEAHDAHGELLGSRRLVDTALRHRDQTPGRLAAALLNETARHQGAKTQHDDQTVLVLRFAGQA